MWQVERDFRIRLGGNIYYNIGHLILFREESLFRMSRSEDGTLAIDFEVYSATGAKLATIRRNNIYGHDRTRFRLEGDADKLELFDRTTESVLVQIKKRLAAHGVELDVSVRSYLPDGRPLVLYPDRSEIGTALMRGCTFGNAPVGIHVM